MSQETLAVVGATSPTGRPEFILLESRYDPAIPAQAETGPAGPFLRPRT